jgi:hypothetical protein
MTAMRWSRNAEYCALAWNVKIPRQKAVCGLAGSGYAVRAGELKSGSKEISGLVSECKQIADLITAAASALAGAAGNPVVESAALGMGRRRLSST